MQTIFALFAFVVGEILSVFIWWYGYSGFLNTFAIPSVIAMVVIVSSFPCIMNLVNVSNYFLVLGPNSTERPSRWTLRNYCRARDIIMPTTLSTIPFHAFCVFGAYSLPTALLQVFTGIAKVCQLVWSCSGGGLGI